MPTTSLPFWDLEATLAEIERCAAQRPPGHRVPAGPQLFGLPGLTDRYWDPLWASAQEKGMPVNFHIASGDIDAVPRRRRRRTGAHTNYASMGVSFFMGNARTISSLICGGMCHRFPELNFVSVESGVGWIPFVLEALDWQWKNCGVAPRAPRVRPAAERVLPSPDLRLLLVRARLGRFAHRAARRRQHPLRDRLPASDEHVARARPASPSAPTTTSSRTSPVSTRRPRARSSTTTPPASTTWTDAGQP